MNCMFCSGELDVIEFDKRFKNSAEAICHQCQINYVYDDMAMQMYSYTFIAMTNDRYYAMTFFPKYKKFTLYEIIANNKYGVANINNSLGWYYTKSVLTLNYIPSITTANKDEKLQVLLTFL